MATFIHAFAEGDKLAYHGTKEDDGALAFHLFPRLENDNVLTLPLTQMPSSASTASTSRTRTTRTSASSSASSPFPGGCLRPRSLTQSSVRRRVSPSEARPHCAVADDSRPVRFLVRPQSKFSTSSRPRSPRSATPRSTPSSSSAVSPLPSTCTLASGERSAPPCPSSCGRRTATRRRCEVRRGTGSACAWARSPSRASSRRGATA